MPTGSGAAQTRFGIAGWGERRAGSFAGKVAASLDTLNLRVTFGGTPVFASGAVAVPSGASNVPWRIEGLFVVRAIGASGIIVGTGSYDNGQSKGLIASAFAASVDTTIDNDVEVTAQWGTANLANNVTVQILTAE